MDSGLTSPRADVAARSAAAEVGFAGQRAVECCGECFAVVEVGLFTGARRHGWSPTSNSETPQMHVAGTPARRPWERNY
jgi:hypothetical protein